ncbi:bifunctional hydroxymethylpyrimidine kinase/phosphomethylpyrimidine kinase [Roseivivax sp. CAU 1761]
MGRISTLLVIAGSDSGGGAGIQADLKTASARGVYAATAITAITAQNTRGVRRAVPLAPDLVAAQIEAVREDIRIDAVKIGMLADADIIAAVARALDGFDGPVVLDPVMVATSGDALLAPEAVAALRDALLPRADLVTPNLAEAAALLGTGLAADPDAAAQQGAALRDCGARAVLVKGGHGTGPVCTDMLVHPGGVTRYEHPRIATKHTHGTGCSLSSAIAADLALGRDLGTAVAAARAWLQDAIAGADRLGVGGGHGPVHHFHAIWP